MNKQKAMVFAALFAALTASVAFFKIPLPFTPVPITLQTLMVLLSGAMLGPVYGALSMIIYLLLGLIGLPVFSGGTAGFGILAGPNGGFLLSFPIAAFAIGQIIRVEKISILRVTMLGFFYSALVLTECFFYILPTFIFVSPFEVLRQFWPYGLLILLSFPMGFLAISQIFRIKNLITLLKYSSFLIILSSILTVFIDAAFKLGILKLWSTAAKSYVPMISLITDTQRIILIIVSLAVLALLLFLIYYAKKSKKFSLDMIFAMFTGTLIIYIFGAMQGTLVTHLGLTAIFVGWILPFIIGDTIKLLLAVWIARSVDINKYLKSS